MKVINFALFFILCAALGQSQDELDQILDEVNREASKSIPRAGSVEELSRKAEPVTLGTALLEEPMKSNKEENNEKEKTNPTSDPITVPDENGKITRMSKNEGLPPGIEETRIYTMRNIKLKPAGNNEWEAVRIPVPVYYRTRSIAWGQDQLRNAFALQQRIAGYLEKLEILKKEGNMLLEEYNKLVLSGIPEEVLGNDSPSIPENLQNASLAAPLRGRDIQISVQGKP